MLDAVVTLSLGSILYCNNMLYFWTAQILSPATFEKVRNYFNMDIVSRWLRCVEASLWKTCHLNKQRVRRTDLLEVRAIEKFIWSIFACLQIRRKYQWCWDRVFYIGVHLLGLKSWNCSVLLLLGEGQNHSIELICIWEGECHVLEHKKEERRLHQCAGPLATWILGVTQELNSCLWLKWSPFLVYTVLIPCTVLPPQMWSFECGILGPLRCLIKCLQCRCLLFD